MKCTVKWNISEKKQREMMKRTNAPVSRDRAEEIEIQPEDLDLVGIELSADGAALLNGGPNSECETALEILQRDREKHNAKIENEKASAALLEEIQSHDAAAAKWARQNWISDRDIALKAVFPGYQYVSGMKTPLLEAEKQFQRRLISDWEEAHRERERLMRKADLDAAAEWIGGIQQKMWDTGNLGVSRLLEALREKAYPQLRPVAYSLCNDNGCSCGAKKNPELSEVEFQRLETLKQQLPNGSTITVYRVFECLRDYDGNCGEDDSQELGITAELKLPWRSLSLDVEVLVAPISSYHGPFASAKDVETYLATRK
jgi:hypothetical protein